MIRRSMASSGERTDLGLRWRWARIAALEDLGPHLGAAVTAWSRRRAAADAHRSIRPLERWDGIPEKSYTTYQADGNLVRIKRVLELLKPGDRVLDVGIGFGYVSGVLMRDSNIAYYCGTDIKGWMLDSARDMVTANGLGDLPHAFEVMDVYDLTPGFVRSHEPSVVLLQEVLEHVDDPVGALRRIVSSTPPGTRVLFTVPILGRLEGVWGHRWVFGVNGVYRLCDEAGLTIDDVEPVHNVWTLVAARTDPSAGEHPGKSHTPLPRLLPRMRPPSKRLSVGSVRDLPTNRNADSYRRAADTARVELDPRRIGVRCSASVAGNAEGPRSAGVRLAVPRPLMLRLELSLEPPRGAVAVHVTGHDEDGQPRLQWTWGGGPGRQPSGERMTHVLKPGRRSRFFTPNGLSDPADVAWVEVWMEVEPGADASLMIHRAAYVGGSEEELTEQIGQDQTAS